MATREKILRVGTYLVPSIPIEFFETVLRYLESRLELHTTLLYESRPDAPHLDIEDPFASGLLDMAFITSAAYLKLRNNNSPIQLIPITTLHKHEKGDGCYTDIIIHKDLSGIAKEFIDLRGYSCAHDKQNSFNSHALTISKLKSLGEDYFSFFSSNIFTGSHVESIKAVIAKKAEVAAVDANCLAFFLKNNPDLAAEIEVLTSWGPLPPYALVVREDLNVCMKSLIHNTFYEMHTIREGKVRLEDFSFNIKKFTFNDAEQYLENALEYEEKSDTKSASAYY